MSLGSTEADKRDYDRNGSYLMCREGAETVGFQQKGERNHLNKLEDKDSLNDLLDDIKEAGSGTEEQKLSASKGRSIGKGLRKRSKKALFVRGMPVTVFKPRIIYPLFFGLFSLCKMVSPYAFIFVTGRYVAYQLSHCYKKAVIWSMDFYLVF